MALRGPRRERGLAKAKNLCFEHDPRHGRTCSAGDACPKEHLDTLQEDLAERWDMASRAWEEALLRRRQKEEKGKSNPQASAAPISRTLPASCAPHICEDLPVPPGIFQVPWYYDERWYRRATAAKLISSASFLACSALWAWTPRLRRYREIHPDTRPVFASDMGERFARMLASFRTPAVLCVEKPYLQGFVDGFAKSPAGEFVLLAVNGGDAPLSTDDQRRIGALPGLKACFAMNLHKPSDGRFFPLPVGLPHHCDGLHRGRLRGSGDAELLIERVRRCAAGWEARDRRLLVTPMQASRLRTRYIEALAQPEFSDLVHVVTSRLDFPEFLSLLSQHRAVLSPPGRGHDCYRTWQALAVGTVPLVVQDPLFDERLYKIAELQVIPFPENLTPDSLKALLERLVNPDPWQRCVETAYWADIWRLHLQDQSQG